MRRFLTVLLCLAAALAGTAVVAVAPPAAAQTVPPDDPDRGLIYEGLREGPTGSRCQGAYEIVSRVRSPAAQPRLRCTHGPDPVPADLDLRPGQDPGFRAGPASPGTAETAAAATGTVPCYGNGTDGYRVQLVYAREPGSPDRYASFEASFRTWAARIDDVFNSSAALTGGIRHIRYVTDSQCRPVIHRMELSAAAVGDFATHLDELDAAGLDRVDRKYLVWVDTPRTKYCGIGIIYDDVSGSTAPGGNVHNGHPAYPAMVGRVDTRCWGQARPVEAHELMHTMGGVQSAPGHPRDAPPNATDGSHCFDESDRLCYADGSGSGDPVNGPVFKADGSPTSLQYRCPASHEALLDCNHDDYFHTNPPAGNWLATHWNTANSAWLERGPPPGTPSIAIAGGTWYSDGTNERSGPAGTTVRAFAVGAFPDVPYQLVTGRDGGLPGSPCRADLVPVNVATRYADRTGFLSMTVGAVNRLPGTYQICFVQLDPLSGPRAVTSGGSFTVE